MSFESDPKAALDSKLLAIVRKFLISFEKTRAADALSLQSDLSKDLGIDSLGRVELFHQIEESFGVYLPENLLAEAEKVSDILASLKNANYSRELVSHIPSAPSEATKVDPSQLKSLVDVLIKRGQKEAKRVHIYYQDEMGKEHPITYGELLTESSKVAASLYQLGIKPGETVAIMLPTSKEFFFTFMGALLAGVVAVPIYPPLRPDKIEEYALREAVILKNAEVRLMVTFHRAEKLAGLLKVFIPCLKTVVTPDQLLKEQSKIPQVSITPNSPAFIQYTSGSTSAPKGVLLTHGNLLANIRAVCEVIQLKPSDVGVSWLPLYHDMGLIGCWLSSFYIGSPVVIMSPLAFLSRPERWLWSLHYHRATVSAAPNFAYELCVKKIKEESIKGLDLSNWRLTFNGAEAINSGTLDRFVKKFEPYGLKKTTMYPAYGLAESSVALILPEPHQEPVIDRIDQKIFEEELRAEPATEGAERTSDFVCVGKPIPGHEVQIINEDGTLARDRKIGRLVFKGPSRMQGYYRNDEATQAAMIDDWLDTGDYAYSVDGSYFITGRRKDLIIKAGRNFYPEEIEDIVGQITDVRKGCVVAFGSVDPQWSTEKIVIVAEVKTLDKGKQSEIIREITEQVAGVIGVPPDEVILVTAGTIPKTSSGKLQRSRCKSLYENKELKAKRLPVWIQIAKLSLRAGAVKVLDSIKLFLRLLYSVYVFGSTLVLVLVLWFGTLMVSREAQRPFARKMARLALPILGMPVKINSHESFPETGTCVYVANHSSYIDAVILLAYLPDNVMLIGKKEVMKMPLIGNLCKRIGVLTVDRHDFSKNIEDTQTIIQAVKKGASVALFPEGTFSYAAGLKPFKLGAFKIAAETHACVIPVSLRGSRNIFRGNNLLLKPGCITVDIGAPIPSTGTDLDEVARLHSAAKKFIADHCGEPVLSG